MTATNVSTLSITPIRAYQDNYVWCIHNELKAWVVDPGDAKVVETFLKQKQLSLCGILITHHHWDHVTGIKDLVKNRDIPVIGPSHKKIPELTQTVIENDSFNVLGIELSVIELPGHTLEHIAYVGQLQEGNPVLFCGDTLFSAGCGRLFEGTPKQMHDSMTKLAQLPNETEVYCTHEYTLSNLAFALAVEPQNESIDTEIQRVEALDLSSQASLPSSLAKEKQINPFLRCHQLSVQEQLKHAFPEKFSNTALSYTEADYFAALRSWKDTF